MLFSFANCQFKLQSQLTGPINRLNSVSHCGFNENPIISYSNGTLALWENSVKNLNRSSMAVCSLFAHEVDENNRYVLIVPQNIEDTHLYPNILFILKNGALEPDNFTIPSGQQLVNGRVGPKHLLTLTTSDGVNVSITIYSFFKSPVDGSLTLQDNPIKKWKLDGKVNDYVGKPFESLKLTSNEQTRFFFDSYGNFILVGRTSGLFQVYTGKSIKNFNANDDPTKKFYIPDSVTDIGYYTSSTTQSKFILYFFTSNATYYSRTIQLVYSASSPQKHLSHSFNNINNNLAGSELTVKYGNWESLTLAQLGNFYCQDRVFGFDPLQKCITDGGNCITNKISDDNIIYCNIDHSKGLAKITAVNFDGTNFVISLYVEQNGIGLLVLWIILGVLGSIIIGVAIAFFVLRSKRGITFKQFITCKCGKKQSADTDYGKLSD